MERTAIHRCWVPSNKHLDQAAMDNHKLGHKNLIKSALIKNNQEKTNLTMNLVVNSHQQQAIISALLARVRTTVHKFDSPTVNSTGQNNRPMQ